MQAHGGKTRAGRRGVTGCPHYNGKECLDIHLLKQAARRALGLRWHASMLCLEKVMENRRWVWRYFATTHTQEQQPEVKSESDFVRQARSLHAALSVGTGAEDLLAASILGAGRVVVVG